jgi:hypothetical protein
MIQQTRKQVNAIAMRTVCILNERWYDGFHDCTEERYKII